MFFKCADRLCDLYISYRQRYVVMEPDGSIYIPKNINGDRPLTNSVVCGHLNQKYAVSVYAGKYSSKFMTFDVDNGSHETVTRIIDILEATGIPRDRIYVSTSGGKGFHVDLFFESLVYTEKLRCLYDYVCIEGGLDPVKVEFRPTHKQAIKLPLSRHGKTGNICWFLNKDTFEPYQYLDYIMEIEKIPNEVVLDVIAGLPVKKPIPAMEDLNPKFSDGVQIKRSAEEECETYEFPILREAGTRHHTMMSIAIYCRSKGYPQEKIESLMLQWAEEQNPDYLTDPDSVIKDDAMRLAEWVWRDDFHISTTERKNVLLSKDDIEKVLAQDTKSMRRILFLLICFEKRFGSLSMSREKIGTYVGCGSICVYESLKKLSARNVIRMAEGKTIAKPGDTAGSFTPVRLPNRYWMNEHYTVPSFMGETEDGVTLNEKFEAESFLSLYYKTLRDMCSESVLKKHLTKSELLEVYQDEQPE